MTTVSAARTPGVGEQARASGPTTVEQATQVAPGHPWVQRPDRHTIVVAAQGELDMLHTPRFADLLNPRLAAAVQTVIVDLSQVSFLGVDALELLINAQRRAQARGITLRLVTGPAAVDRALRAASTHTHADLYASRHEALSSLPTSAA